MNNNALRQKIWNFIFGWPNRLESEGAVEVFNKTVEDCLSYCYENDKFDDIEWDLTLTMSGFLHFIIRNKAYHN